MRLIRDVTIRGLAPRRVGWTIDEVQPFGCNIWARQLIVQGVWRLVLDDEAY